jgi:hypothetical protein
LTEIPLLDRGGPGRSRASLEAPPGMGGGRRLFFLPPRRAFDRLPGGRCRTVPSEWVGA